jgi:hypothetical protein
MVRHSFVGLLILATAGLTGCGSAGSAPTAEVKGKVTYQGNPVPNVNVTFTPDNGRPALGTTNENGEFTLSTFSEADGAVPGMHTVTLATNETEPMPGTPEAANYQPKPLPFPEKYTSPATSDLKVEVKDGSNDIPLELKD